MNGRSGQNVTQAVAKEPEPGQGHALVLLNVLAIQLSLSYVWTIQNVHARLKRSNVSLRPWPPFTIRHAKMTIPSVLAVEEKAILAKVIVLIWKK